VLISNLTWTGQVGGVGASQSLWDNGTFDNWAAGAASIAYSDGLPVIFQDTNAVAGGNVTNTAVTVCAGGVAPLSVTFTKSAVNYTLTSTDSVGITGTTGLTMSGSGSVFLNGANTFTGGVFINSGTI